MFRILLPDFFEGDPDRTPDEADFPAHHTEKSAVMVHAAASGAKTKSAPLAPHNLDLLYAINKRDVELYYYILGMHQRRVRLCLRTNGEVRGARDHGDEGDVPDWATKDVTALLRVKDRPE